MPQSGCYVKRKRWTDTLHLGYEPGVYLLVGENPNTSAPGAAAPASVPPSEWCNTSDLAPSEWRNASGLQPAPYGFEKKNCASEYVICDERGAARDAGRRVSPLPSVAARARPGARVARWSSVGNTGRDVQRLAAQVLRGPRRLLLPHGGRGPRELERGPAPRPGPADLPEGGAARRRAPRRRAAEPEPAAEPAPARSRRKLSAAARPHRAPRPGQIMPPPDESSSAPHETTSYCTKTPPPVFPPELDRLFRSKSPPMSPAGSHR